MIHTIFGILLRIALILFAVWGFIEVMRVITLLITKGRKDNFLLILSPVISNENDTEFNLRSMLCAVKWMGKTRPRRVLILDTDMSESTKKICRLICKEYEYPELVTKEELDAILIDTNRKR